jgi:hypothetical protein
MVAQPRSTALRRNVASHAHRREGGMARAARRVQLAQLQAEARARHARFQRLQHPPPKRLEQSVRFATAVRTCSPIDRQKRASSRGRRRSPVGALGAMSRRNDLLRSSDGAEVLQPDSLARSLLRFPGCPFGFPACFVHKALPVEMACLAVWFDARIFGQALVGAEGRRGHRVIGKRCTPSR